MNSYLIHFAVYSFAMVGFIVAALFVYKKTMYSNFKSMDKSFLQVDNTLKLSPSKTLYVIKAGHEKFLIAGDSSTTTMLSKLDNMNEFDIYDSYKTQGSISKISVPKSSVKKIGRG